MGKFSKKPPKAPGPSKKQVQAQEKQEKLADAKEDSANRELSSVKKAALGRRTGRRLLLAPGREDQISRLGGAGNTGTNF